MKSLKIPKR